MKLLEGHFSRITIQIIISTTMKPMTRIQNALNNTAKMLCTIKSMVLILFKVYITVNCAKLV